MSKGRFEACLAGFMFGFVWDVFAVDIFGMRMLLFTLIGYFVGLASRNFDRNQIYAQILGVFLANIAYWGGIAAVYYVFSSKVNNIFSIVFTLRNFFSLILTIIATPFAFLFFRVLDAAFKPRRY
jgi:rod shape-determining protein MreD